MNVWISKIHQVFKATSIWRYFGLDALRSQQAVISVPEECAVSIFRVYRGLSFHQNVCLYQFA
jgi:hypothetical protein